MADIKAAYNAKLHPEVQAGKKTEDAVLMEFMETFEMHHNTMSGEAADTKVTKEEFEEYYANISASIDDDKYFELMMQNTWKMGEAGKPVGKAWKSEPEEVKKPPSAIVPPPLGTKNLKRCNIANMSSAENTLNFQKVAGKPSTAASSSSPEALLEKLRKRLAARGARGILGLARQFKIMDDNGSKTLDPEEWLKALRDYRVELDEASARVLMKALDKDQSGRIDYNEFLRGIRGEMNAFRKNIVLTAFSKLDKDNSGMADLNDLKGVFSAKNHPDVKAGRKSEDEVLGEFLETFELHRYLHEGPGSKGVDRKVTKDEFLEYYSNVSACIDDDKYFELMMNNAWKLAGVDSSKGAAPWRSDYAAVTASQQKKPYAVHEIAPYGTSQMPTDYSTALRPKPVAGKLAEETKMQKPAGYPTYKPMEPMVMETPISKGTPKGKGGELETITGEEAKILDVCRSFLAQRGID